MSWLALDIGGANLKVADGVGYAESFPFALWRDSVRLAQELRTVIAQAPACDHLAVTMTGELADCFESKSEGVSFILDSVSEASDGRHTRVYLSDGRFECYPRTDVAETFLGTIAAITDERSSTVTYTALDALEDDGFTVVEQYPWGIVHSEFGTFIT